MAPSTKQAFGILLEILVELIHRVGDDGDREDLAHALEELREIVNR